MIGKTKEAAKGREVGAETGLGAKKTFSSVRSSEYSYLVSVGFVFSWVSVFCEFNQRYLCPCSIYAPL